MHVSIYNTEILFYTIFKKSLNGMIKNTTSVTIKQKVVTFTLILEYM